MTTKELLIQEIDSMSERELLEKLNIIRTVKQKQSDFLQESNNTEDWYNFCLNNLNECYGDDEPEYSLESIMD